MPPAPGRQGRAHDRGYCPAPRRRRQPLRPGRLISGTLVSPDWTNRLDTAEERHAQVKQDHVRLQLSREEDGLTPILRLRHRLEPRGSARCFMPGDVLR